MSHSQGSGSVLPVVLSPAILLPLGLATSVVAAGLTFASPWAAQFWPFPERPLSSLFLGSVFAAVGVGILMVAAMRDPRGAEAGTVALVVMFAGFAATLLAQSPREPRVMVFAVAYVVILLAAAVAFLASRRVDPVAAAPLPLLLRASLGVFAVLLVLVGVTMLGPGFDIFPWPLNPASAPLFGWIYLGVAASFVFALLYATWSVGRVILASFLVYDLVLIGPFLKHLAVVQPQRLTSLVVYIAVLIVSGALAIYYLFLAPSTRLWGRR